MFGRSSRHRAIARCSAAPVVWLATIVLRVAGAQQMPPHESALASHPHQASVSFPIHCTAAARREFERGVALLHSFWYEEAKAVFGRVTRIDRACAMGYWGLAMTYYHPLWEPLDSASRAMGWAAVEGARRVGTSDLRERAYLAAAESLYAPTPRHTAAERAAAFERAMAALHARYPDDHEGALLYVLALLSTAPFTDTTYAQQRRAAAILDSLTPLLPDHPGVIHYAIHAFDAPPLARRGLAAARRYAAIAPAVPHAQHMPSHIFTRLGLWRDAIRSNQASAAAAHAYELRAHLTALWDEHLHALDYLVYAALQLGEDRTAAGVLEAIRRAPGATPENFKAAYAFAAIPARYALERGAWEEAAHLAVTPAHFPWSRFPWAEGITHFARAIGAARMRDTVRAAREVAVLGAIENTLAVRGDAYWARQVEIQWRAARGWLEQASGRVDAARRLLRSAADLEDATQKHPVTPGAVLPARELLADLLLLQGEPRLAEAEYRRVLTATPNRFRSVFGAGRAAEAAGDSLTARQFYAQLVAQCREADLDRAELARAWAFLSARRAAR